MASRRTNDEWLHDLSASGLTQEAAITDLRDHLLRAAMYFFSRNRDDLVGLSRDEILQRAEDCAQDALIAVMNHLPDFRGDSQFTTWAYKFAINTALVAARRERWKEVSLDDLSQVGESTYLDWALRDQSATSAPDRTAMQNEVRELIREVIEHKLTENQRQVLILMVFQNVPLDEVARYMGSNRNAIYKMLHDARRKLKSSLSARGFEVAEILTSFGA